MYPFHLIKGNKRALKGFLISFALDASVQFTANYTITTYAVMIFERSGTSIDPYFSSIIMALALIVGSFLTTYLADILGRRILNITSLAGSAIGLFTVAIYHYLNINGYDLSAFAWVPVVSLSFVVFISSAGINALSTVCSIEYLSPKVSTQLKYIGCITWKHITRQIRLKAWIFRAVLLKRKGCCQVTIKKNTPPGQSPVFWVMERGMLRIPVNIASVGQILHIQSKKEWKHLGSIGIGRQSGRSHRLKEDFTFQYSKRKL